MEVLTEKAVCSTCHFFIPYESTQGQIGECRKSSARIEYRRGHVVERWTKVTANHNCEHYKSMP